MSNVTVQGRPSPVEALSDSVREFSHFVDEQLPKRTGIAKVLLLDLAVVLVAGLSSMAVLALLHQLLN